MDLTRRQALGLGAAALGALRFPATALASPGPDLFELPLGRLNAKTWHVTKILRPGKRFDLVGLTWSPRDRVQGQVRARTTNGRWTRWTPLPHAHATLDGTDPAFTNTADELQLRLRGHAQHLTAR